nr:retrovirus-related Pol polyprotein from transposon TNT 1-94 [Tanacetum cinerariifolium]
MQTHTSNTLHNAIMEAGGKDHPPMLAPGNYIQWKSRIKRYIDTKPNHELIYYCLKNPPYKYTWADKTILVSEGIDNDIYSTVDACPNACEMWKVIERLKQGESINVQDLKTNLYWEFRKFTSQDGESLESYYSRFYKMMNELVRNQCDVTNHQVNVQFLFQLQPEWQRNRGKVIVNSPPPIYDQEPSMVAEDDEMSKDKEIDKFMALISLSFKKIYKPMNNNLRTSSNTSRANQDNSLRITEALEVNPDAATDFGTIFDTEPLQKVCNDDNYNVFSIESDHPEQSKYVHDTYPIEQDEHNVIIDSLDMSSDREQIDHDDDDDDDYDDDLANEHKELDKVIALENKVKVLDNIVYKIGQSVQTMNMLNSKCRMSFAKPEFLKKAQRENPRLYDIGCYNDNLDLMLAPESDKVIRLEKESRSKLSDLIKPFDYDKLNNLYDLFVTQREKSSEQRYFSERSKMSHTSVNNGNSKESFNKQTTLLEKRINESNSYDQKCKSSKELFKIKRSVGSIFNGVEHCKETIAKRTYFSHIDPFIQNTIEANFCPEIQRISADLEKFHMCLKEEMVADLRYFNSLELEVDSLRSQLETHKTQFLNEINRLSREYYYADHMNVILGVYTELDESTNLQCDYLETLDKCECHEKELSKSKMMSKSFEALQKHAINLEIDLQQCQEKIKMTNLSKKINQSISQRTFNAKTSNVNFVCTICGKCVLNEKHDMCVFKSRYGLNSRTKMPIVVPVSTREPKGTVKQSVVNPLRKTVALESNQKPRNTTRKLYEHVSKTCSWWYPKFTPPGYNWKPKSEIGNVKPNLIEIILFIVDSGCSKHMTGNIKLLINFVEKFLGSPGTDLYSITLQDTTSPNPVCIMAKATSPQTWLWHHRLSHLNFDTINLLSKNDIVVGLPKLKFVKDHLCSSYLCGPMRIASINGKKYILVIVDDYSRYTWTHFLRSKDETPEVVIDFLRLVQRGLHAQVRIVRTNKGTEFLNQTLHAYFASEGILHQTSVARTPEQNSVVKRRNRTLVEAAQTMLSAAKVPLFFWAKAIATACFTQNRSLVIPRHEKTPYHIINDQKPSVKFFYIFGSLCYIVSDGKNLDKMKEKGDACIFVGYSTQSRAYRVFNKRTRMIVETIHVNFDELPQMASDHVSSDLVPQCQNKTVTTLNEMDLLFSTMFDELLNGSTNVVSKSSVVTTTDTPNQHQQQHTTPLNTQTTTEPTFENDEFINIFSAPVQDRGETSSHHVDSSNMHTFYQRHPSEHRWMKDHPLEQVIGNPSQSVRTRRIQIHQSPRGIFINQDKYAQAIIIKHGMTSCDSVGTPMATKHLDADLSGTPVDQTKYQSMVGALMYLTASRSDIVHATCYCARYQAKLTEKHLTAVKQIFWYLKDTIHMGLWYLKDTGFELTAFSYSDHAGYLDSRKSTSGGIQFLGGDKLVSWSSKKQDCTLMSSAEAEYVSLSA